MVTAGMENKIILLWKGPIYHIGRVVAVSFLFQMLYAKVSVLLNQCDKQFKNCKSVKTIRGLSF